jgi:hypothetical protein
MQLVGLHFHLVRVFMSRRGLASVLNRVGTHITPYLTYIV